VFTVAPHVECCLADNHVLLLDLRRGRYLGLSDEAVRKLGKSVDRLPHLPDDGPTAALAAATDAEAADDILREMLLDGVIVTQTLQRPDPANSDLSPPKRPLVHGYESVDAVVKPLHCARFALACARAFVLLRWFSLETLSKRLVRKSRRIPLTSPDDPRLRMLIGVFQRLRPFLYTSHDACLFNSLAIHEFLAMHGLRAQFVIGVAAKPFKAHCWLQIGGTVVNDGPDHVWQYTPILVR
jgi:hypothetical protein